MRSYIFRYSQEKILENHLSLQEILILDYLERFSEYDKAIFKIKNGEKYLFISPKKILSDLPILGIKERQLRNLMASLEEKKCIKRLKALPGECYICLTTRQLFAGSPEKFCKPVGNFLPEINDEKIEKIKKINKKNYFENYAKRDYSTFDFESVFDDLDTLEI